MRATRVLLRRATANTEPVLLRSYFYTICHKGRVYGEETKRRNLATCIKDNYFLDFFLAPSRIKPIEELRNGKRASHYAFTLGRIEESFGLDSKTLDERYPFVSVCGRELNFINPEETVIVFNKLEGDELVFAANRRVKFDPAELRMKKDGKLFHPAPVGGYGLVSSDVVAMHFAEHLVMESSAEQVGLLWGSPTVEHTIPIVPRLRSWT